VEVAAIASVSRHATGETVFVTLALKIRLSSLRKRGLESLAHSQSFGARLVKAQIRLITRIIAALHRTVLAIFVGAVPVAAIGAVVILARFAIAGA
jgi:hypothetical protein